MGFSRAAGYPDFSSAGTNKFIPQVWSSKMARKYYNKTVLTYIANNDYEGGV
ncbi:MAG: hypothetical protein UU10_C0041G0006 [Parcubacteria group bacterium GW2011_GWF1_40_6]|nr:MAG: hypothetical protein UU10_C0041G0006 [Parcubacteria group bacterium GW2011_GWF1_40_6]HLA29309.1 hypothetical protein [Syntrophales bacterium]